jgi:hypothetical protein
LSGRRSGSDIGRLPGVEHWVLVILGVVLSAQVWHLPSRDYCEGDLKKHSFNDQDDRQIP